MRSEFVEVSTVNAAWVACPWAAEIVAVEGGYRAFESVADHDAWMAACEECHNATRKEIVDAVDAAGLYCPADVVDACLRVAEAGGDWREELRQAVINDAAEAAKLGL